MPGEPPATLNPNVAYERGAEKKGERGPPDEAERGQRKGESQHQPQRRQNAKCPPDVECRQAYRAVPLLLAQQQRGYDVAADDEEELYAEAADIVRERKQRPAGMAGP